MNKFITLTVACFALFVQADAASNKATVEKLYDLYENGTAREFADTYASLVAEDYYRWLGRYVGLGFRMNDDEMTVAEVVNSPAKDHLKPGDKILSVNGVKAKEGNELPFQGPLGGEVKVKLERDGKKMTVKMNRALQTNTGDKERMLGWLSTFNEEDWKDRSKVIQRNPVVAEGNEVYASFESKDTNEDGNEVRWWTVERFIFNDSGQIVHHGDINEDLLIAQQNGYKLSK